MISIMISIMVLRQNNQYYIEEEGEIKEISYLLKNHCYTHDAQNMPEQPTISKEW